MKGNISAAQATNDEAVLPERVQEALDTARIALRSALAPSITNSRELAPLVDRVVEATTAGGRCP